MILNVTASLSLVQDSTSKGIVLYFSFSFYIIREMGVHVTIDLLKVKMFDHLSVKSVDGVGIISVCLGSVYQINSN